MRQDTNILKRGEFLDEKIGVRSVNSPCFDVFGDYFYIWGTEEAKDSEILIVEDSVAEEIMDRVNKINEKYSGFNKELKQCCRNCHHLDPSVSDYGYYDIEDNYVPEYRLSICQYCDTDYLDVNEINECPCFEPINIEKLFC